MLILHGALSSAPNIIQNYLDPDALASNEFGSGIRSAPYRYTESEEGKFLFFKNVVQYDFSSYYLNICLEFDVLPQYRERLLSLKRVLEEHKFYKQYISVIWGLLHITNPNKRISRIHSPAACETLLSYARSVLIKLKLHFESLAWKCVLANTDSVFLIPPENASICAGDPLSLCVKKYVESSFEHLRIKIEDTYKILAIKGHSYLYISELNNIGSKSIKKISPEQRILLKEYLMGEGISYDFLSTYKEGTSKEFAKNVKSVQKILAFPDKELGTFQLRIWGPSVDYIKSFDEISEMCIYIQKCDFNSYSVHERFKDTEIVRLVLDVDGAPEELFQKSFEELQYVLKNILAMKSTDAVLTHNILSKEINPLYKRVYFNIAFPKHLIPILLHPWNDVFDSQIYSGACTLRIPKSPKYISDTCKMSPNDFYSPDPEILYKNYLVQNTHGCHIINNFLMSKETYFRTSALPKKRKMYDLSTQMDVIKKFLKDS